MKENRGYSLVAAELWLISVALAAGCGAAWWWLDQNQQEPMPGGTGGLGGQPAETVSDHLEGIFITEDENFALIEKSFDEYTQENGNPQWSSNRSAFGFFIEGRVSADGKPNTLFPYVIADDGQRVAVFAWGGDSDFTELQLVREEGKVRWEETDGDVHFSAETHLAGGYLVYLTPEGKEVRVELPRGGKLAALINVEVEALQPIEPAFQASWTPTGEFVLTMTTEPEKTASAMPPTETEPTPLPSATPKPPTRVPPPPRPTLPPTAIPVTREATLPPATIAPPPTLPTQPAPAGGPVDSDGIPIDGKCTNGVVDGFCSIWVCYLQDFQLNDTYWIRRGDIGHPRALFALQDIAAGLAAPYTPGNQCPP